MGNSVVVIAADESTGNVYGGGEGSGLHNVDYTSSTLDPELTVGSKSISYDGRLNKSQTFTETISVAPDSYNPTAATNDGKYNLNLSWTELTNTVNPNVSISSGNGSQTVEYASTLEDGVSTDLSDQIDATNIEGQTTLTVGLASPDSGPSPKVGLNYSHTAQNKISTNYTASKFEESYNTSTTYADSTDEAKLTIPFDSSSVVDVKTVEYRIDDSSWRQIGESNRRFENAELTAYIADEYGSSIPDGSTVDVRATGRKIDVENGRLTITDPTKPGEELDTQLEIQSRSSGFSLNVGPTANGKRVHYANSEDYTTDDYVVIEADGDQDLYLPKSKAGDRFRVKHLDTKVSADVGDVRIDVLEAGSEPKLDVSPGPGGAGDPVTIEYYNTRSGVEYLLNSVVDNIVVDSDIANSPAILEDDDSDDTWQILEEQTATGTSSSSSVTEVVGQFAAEQSSGLLGMISIPVLGSPLLWLVGFVGLGVVYWRTDFLSAASSSTSAGASVAANRSGSLLKTLVEKVGSGLLVVIRVLLDYSARIVALLTRNRSATIVTGILLTIFGTATGLIPIPPGVGIVVVGAGIPVASFLVLKRAGAYSQRVMILSSLGGILLGLSVVAPGAIQTAVAQLTSENVAPLLILATAGGGYLWWRQRNAEASTPDTVNRISFPTIRGGSDENNDGSN